MHGKARSSINGFPNTSVLKKFDSYSQIFWMLFGRLEAIDSVGIDLWVMIDIEGLRSTYGVSATFRQQVWAVLEWLEDFKKTRFADFLWERTRRFFTYTLAPFLSNITSNMETRTISHLSEQIDKLIWFYLPSWRLQEGKGVSAPCSIDSGIE
jgi:hypothetical protein